MPEYQQSPKSNEISLNSSANLHFTDLPVPASVLVIVAHADDMDFYCSGLLTKWINQGTEVNLVVVTSGDKGSNVFDTDPQRLVITREQEQLASAQIIGIKEVVFLHYPDGELIFANKRNLQSDIVRQIRRFKPEVLVTHDPMTRLKRVHSDHRTVGEAVRDAAFPISEICNCYPEQINLEGLTTWQAQKLMYFDTDLPNYFIDIRDVLETKIKAISEHRSQEYIFTGGSATCVTNRASKIGAKYGLEAAEEYLVINLVESH